MDISIVIPNYNGEKILEKNLPKVLASIKGYSNGSVEIIIADDASTDNSLKIIQQFVSHAQKKEHQIKLVTNVNPKKRGFSKNVNRAASIATGEIIFLLNTDVVPHSGFLEPVIKHFSDKKVFAVGCMDESIENGKIVLHGRGIATWKRGFLLHSAGALDKNNTLWVSGGSGAYRKSLWEKLGGLNELYNPFYWEDIDICYRAEKSGYQAIFEKESRVTHEHEKGAIKTLVSPEEIDKIAYRNQFIFVWLNITDKNLILNHIFWIPFHVLQAVKSGNKAFLLGFSKACVKLPQILSYRKKMKKLFIYSDNEILHQFRS